MLERVLAHGPQHVAITGASRGIGAALARAYAAPGRRQALAGRDRSRLEAVAAACRAAGGEVTTDVFDVRDQEAAAAWFRKIDAVQPVDLLIANAGIFDGNGADGRWETPEESQRLVEINLTGVINTVQPAKQAMRPRRAGRIAIISSLAAVLPAADAPTYSATKAALVAYADALRILLASENVGVSVVLPGHVRTRQTEAHVGPLAMIMGADEAAAIIKRGLDRGQAMIAFPRRAHWLVWLASILPWRLKALATRGDRFHVRKDPDPPSSA
jgi:short-subunit dehydrogenase